MATKTDILRAGLKAKDWKPCQTPSGRECYTKQLPNRKTGKLQDTFMFLSSNATLRWNVKNAFSTSISCNSQQYAAYEKAGREALGKPGVIDSDELLKGLDK